MTTFLTGKINESTPRGTLQKWGCQSKKTSGEQLQSAFGVCVEEVRSQKQHTCAVHHRHFPRIAKKKISPIFVDNYARCLVVLVLFYIDLGSIAHRLDHTVQVLGTTVSTVWYEL